MRNSANISAISSAREVLDRHISALNAGDAEAVAATLHFPHVRLSGVSLKTWETADHYFDDFLARAGGEWNYSRFNDIRIVQASDRKVHIDLEVLRYRKDDTIITRFRSLWIILEIESLWAAKFRSSFASL